jgi:hypothetical protein
MHGAALYIRSDPTTMPQTEPNGKELSTDQLALRNAQRAVDNALLCICELAHSIESLREAIAGAKTESYTELLIPLSLPSATLLAKSSVD